MGYSKKIADGSFMVTNSSGEQFKVNQRREVRIEVIDGREVQVAGGTRSFFLGAVQINPHSDECLVFDNPHTGEIYHRAN